MNILLSHVRLLLPSPYFVFSPHGTERKLHELFCTWHQTRNINHVNVSVLLETVNKVTSSSFNVKILVHTVFCVHTVFIGKSSSLSKEAHTPSQLMQFAISTRENMQCSIS